MSSIDERIVQMRFDNKDFESNVGTTMSTLEKLKEKLKFTKSDEGIRNLKNSFNGMDFSNISDNVESLNNKFSAFGIAGMEIIRRLTNAAIDMGIKLAKAVTITPVFDGYSEYENQINSTQTIIANTGRSIEDVTKALDELNEYADLTIYDFGNMTRSAGLFTAAIGNQPDALEKSTKALKGIGNWAAYAGADRETFNRITYQLSQGAAAGAIRLMDWRSVETAAGMSGANYKQAFIDTAEAMGVIEKGSITIENFRDTLKDGWLTADVFFETMSKFADDPAMTDAATKVKTFTQLIDTMKEALGTGWATSFRYIIGNFDEAKDMWSAAKDALEEVINPISDARNEMLKFWHDNGGRDDMINSVRFIWQRFKEIGGFLKDIAGQSLGSLFGTLDGKRLVEITKSVHDFLQQTAPSLNFIRAMRSVLTAVFDIFETKVGHIQRMGRAFAMFWEAIRPGRVLLYSIVEDLGAVVSTIMSTINGVFDSFENTGGLQALANGFANVFNGLMKIVKPVSTFLLTMFQEIYNSEFMQMVGTRLTAIAQAFESFTSAINFEAVGSVAVTVLNAIWNVIKLIGTAALPFVDGIINFVTSILSIGDSSRLVVGDIQSLSDVLDTFKSNIQKWFESRGLTEMFDDISDKLDKLSKYLQPIRDRIDAIRASFENGTWYHDLKEWLKWLVEKIDELRTKLWNFVKDKTVQNFTALWSGICWVFGKVIEGVNFVIQTFKDLIAYITSGSVTGAIKTLLILWGLFNAADIIKNLNDIVKGLKKKFLTPLKFITEDLGKAIGKVGKSFVEGLVTPFEPLMQKAKAVALKEFAKAVAILTIALIALSYTDFGKLQGGLLILGTLMGEMVFFERALMAFNNSITASKKKGFSASLGSNMIKDAAGLLILAVAVKKLAALKPEEMAQGLAGVAVLMVEMYLFMQAADKTAAGTKGLIGLAIAVGVLALSIKSLSKLDFGALMTGLAGVTGLLVGLGVFLSLIGGMQTVGLKSAGAIVLVALAITMLSGVVKSFGNMDFPNLLTGLAGLASILLALWFFLDGTKKMDVMGLKSAAALILVATAIKMLGSVVKSLGSMDFGSLLTGLTGIAGLLLGLYLFMKKTSTLDDLSLKSMTGLILMATAVKILAGAVTSMGGMDPLSFAQGLAGVAVSIIFMAGAIKLLEGTGPTILLASAAMVVMAAAVIALTVPMLIFAQLPFEKLMTGLAGVVAAFMVFGVAGTIIGGAAVPMIAAGGAMLVMAAAVWVLVPPILALAAMPWPNLFAAIVAIAGAFLALGGTAAVLSAMSTFTFTAAASLLALAGAAAACGGALILIGAGLKVLAGGIRTIGDLILALLDNILSGIPIIGDDIHDTITEHRKRLKEDFAKDEAEDIGLKYAEGVGEGMKDGFDNLSEAGKGMADKATESLGDGVTKAKESGSKIATAVGDGYKQAAPQMTNSVNTTNDQFLATMRQKFIEEGRGTGRDFDQMMAHGISDNSDTVKESGDGLASLLKGVDMSVPADSLGIDFTNALGDSGIDVERAVSNWGVNAQNGLGDMQQYFTQGGEVDVNAFLDSLNKGESKAERQGNDLGGSAVDGIEDTERDAYDAGQNFGYGFADGTTSTTSYVETAASNLARRALNAMKTELNEASPSKETRKYGKFGGLGLGLGFKDTTTYVKTQAANLADRGLIAMQSTMEKLREALNFDPNIDPTISPVMDLSQIQNGMNTIGSMFGSRQFAVAGAFGMDPYAFNTIRNVTSAADRAPANNDDVVSAVGALRGEIATLKSAMEQMKFEADGRVIGQVAYREVDRRLGNTVARNRREGRG